MSKINLSVAFVTALLASTHAQAGIPDGEAVRAGLIANFDDIAANKRVTVAVPCDGQKCIYQSATHTNYYINDHFMLPISPGDGHAREVLMNLLTHAPIRLEEKKAPAALLNPDGIHVFVGRQFDIDLKFMQRLPNPNVKGYPDYPPPQGGHGGLPPEWKKLYPPEKN